MALKHESESVTVSPVLKQRIDAKRGRGSTFRVRALAAGAVALVLAIVGIVYFASRPEEKQGLVSTPTAQPTTVPSTGASLATPDDAFHCFFEAKHYRDFEAGKTCMTDRYSATFTDPVGFIGPSSPSLQRATILTSTVSDAKESFALRTYYGTPTGLTSTAEGQLSVIREANGTWLVDEYSESNNRPVQQTMRVGLAFFAPVPRSCDNGTTPDSAFATISREVVDEPSTNVIQEHLMTVAQELFTGPWTWEGNDIAPAASSIRVGFVDKNGDEIRYSIHREISLTAVGLQCDYTRDALQRTVRALPGLENAHVTITEGTAGP